MLLHLLSTCQEWPNTHRKNISDNIFTVKVLEKNIVTVPVMNSILTPQSSIALIPHVLKIKAQLIVSPALQQSGKKSCFQSKLFCSSALGFL